MLISIGLFAGALTAMGTLGVPVASPVASPATSTLAPLTTSTSLSLSPSNTPTSRTSPPAGGRDDASSATDSTSTHSTFAYRSDN